MDIITTNRGGAAIQTLGTNDFDAALVDLKMEDMAGIDLLKAFKK